MSNTAGLTPATRQVSWIVPILIQTVNDEVQARQPFVAEISNFELGFCVQLHKDVDLSPATGCKDQFDALSSVLPLLTVVSISC
jgi:hypothetical protein